MGRPHFHSTFLTCRKELDEAKRVCECMQHVVHRIVVERDHVCSELFVAGTFSVDLKCVEDAIKC